MRFSHAFVAVLAFTIGSVVANAPPKGEIRPSFEPGDVVCMTDWSKTMTSRIPSTSKSSLISFSLSLGASKAEAYFDIVEAGSGVDDAGQQDVNVAFITEGEDVTKYIWA
ncbi:hypothetical protein F4782DRAFT_58049 [Xylaria castorea]|nr:hypothetical protein F4782DRAFT_58049 [Xylaria castorea]